MLALTGGTLLTPTEELTDHALLIDGDTIEALVPHKDIPQKADQLACDGFSIAPGFIDVQVNGGGGALFNDAPSPETIATIGAAHQKGGTTAFLPTLISSSREKMTAAQDAVDEALRQKLPGVVGLHLEGPFLNPVKKGIHNAGHFRGLDQEAIQALTRPRDGVLLVTLAPETTGPETIAQLVRHDIRVAAGHTAATFAETQQALAAGLSGFTHLFNAMAPLQSRAPGPIAAALESDAWCGLIADGHHVDEAMLRLAIRAKTDGRLMLVTDAMTMAGTNQTSFTFEGETIEITEGRCVNQDGTLAGSNLTMAQAIAFSTEKLGLTLQQAVRMASYEPACFLGLQHQRGALAPGLRADLNLIPQNTTALTTILAGCREHLTAALSMH